MSDSAFLQLLDAARAGDEYAFADLFRSVQPHLLRYLRTVGGQYADDVAAETWVSVVRGLDRFRGDEAGWRAWVFTIARARLVDAQRRASRTPLPVDTTELLAEQADTADVEASVEELISTEAALRAIGRLPREQAEMVLLRHVVGMDVAQVAEVVGKRPGAVRVAVHRGLRRLADQLHQAEGRNGEVPGQRTQQTRGGVRRG